MKTQKIVRKKMSNGCVETRKTAVERLDDQNCLVTESRTVTKKHRHKRSNHLNKLVLLVACLALSISIGLSTNTSHILKAQETTAYTYTEELTGYMIDLSSPENAVLQTSTPTFYEFSRNVFVFVSNEEEQSYKVIPFECKDITEYVKHINNAGKTYKIYATHTFDKTGKKITTYKLGELIEGQLNK